MNSGQFKGLVLYLYVAVCCPFSFTVACSSFIDEPVMGYPWSSLLVPELQTLKMITPSVCRSVFLGQLNFLPNVGSCLLEGYFTHAHLVAKYSCQIKTINVATHAPALVFWLTLTVTELANLKTKTAP